MDVWNLRTCALKDEQGRPILEIVAVNSLTGRCHGTSPIGTDGTPIPGYSTIKRTDKDDDGKPLGGVRIEMIGQTDGAHDSLEVETKDKEVIATIKMDEAQEKGGIFYARVFIADPETETLTGEGKSVRAYYGDRAFK